jgi:kojibiose phosphorylase
MRDANFRYYEPRTEHGSSLSPSIHALVAARLGDMEAALRYFRQACEIDLADNMGNAAGGVHIASLGGIWQTIAFGFAGLGLGEDGLSFLPHCPAAWHFIRFSLCWQGRRLALRIGTDRLEIELTAGAGMPVSVDGVTIRLEPGRTSSWERNAGFWKEAA